MHIWIMSDLHLNDLPLEISTPSPIPDVLVVAGDAMAPSPAAFHSQCLRGRQSRLGSAPPPKIYLVRGIWRRTCLIENSKTAVGGIEPSGASNGARSGGKFKLSRSRKRACALSQLQ